MLQDEFGTSNPIGSSRHVGKILGCYYQAIHDKILASKRAGIETLALLEDCDINKFGLKASLEVPLAEVKSLVETGLYDRISRSVLGVRVLANLGDNLGQHKVYFCHGV